MINLRVRIKTLNLQPHLEDIFKYFYHRPYPFILESGTKCPLRRSGSEARSPEKHRGGIIQEPLGRFSFLGSDPFLAIKTKGREITLIESGKIRRKTGNPFKELRNILNRYRIERHDYPVPFIGGGVGYLGYDLCHFIERLPRAAGDDLNFPDMFFGFYHRLIAVDHKLKKTYLINLVNPKEGSPISDLDSRIEELLVKSRAISTRSIESKKQSVRMVSNFTRSRYLRTVQQVKEYIAAGDIYQANLSQRFGADFNRSALELFQVLRQINPAPFLALLRPSAQQVVISSSPERFLRMQNRYIETRPIKGTRPRGRTGTEDRRLKRELDHSKKDNAELAMIVDLERNDLGRVCKYGTVRVRESKVLETYPTVFHLVATVEGKLHPRYDVVDLLKATFPGGSITGAPKIRAMEIIDELEPTRRNVYTGAIGYLGFNRNIDLSIAIRILMLTNHKAYLQVGGGIVADSRPIDEYEETITKGKALVNTLRLLGKHKVLQ